MEIFNYVVVFLFVFFILMIIYALIIEKTEHQKNRAKLKIDIISAIKHSQPSSVS